MASNEKDLKLKLSATGGAAAAKEVEKVEAAVQDLGKATDAAKGPDLSQMVPAWEQTTKAVEDTTEAQKEVVASSSDVDSAFQSTRERVAALRAKLEEMRGTVSATAGAGGATASGGGLRGLGSALLSLAGGPIGVALVAVTAFAGWLRNLKQRADEAASGADALESRIDELKESLFETADADDRAAAAAEAHATAMDLILDRSEGVLTAIETRRKETELAAAAERDYKTAVLERLVAEGKISKEDAALQKGEIAKQAESEKAANDLAAAKEKIAAAAREIAKAEAAATAARWQAMQAEKTPTGAMSQAQAATAAAERAKNAVQQQEQQAPSIGLGRMTAAGVALGPAAIDYALEQKAHTETMEALQKEAALRTAEAEKWQKLADEEQAEKTKLVAAARQQVENAEQAVKALREEQAGAVGEYRSADQRARLAGGIGAATIDERTRAEVAQLEAKRREEEARAADKARKEQERADRERQAAEMQRQRDELEAQQRAAAPGFADRAQNVEAAGLVGTARLIQSGAAGLANGAGLSEVESALFAAAQMIEGAPENQARLIQSALAPYISAMNSYKAKLDQIEAQLRNNPNR